MTPQARLEKIESIVLARWPKCVVRTKTTVFSPSTERDGSVAHVFDMTRQDIGGPKEDDAVLVILRNADGEEIDSFKISDALLPEPAKIPVCQAVNITRRILGLPPSDTPKPL